MRFERAYQLGVTYRLGVRPPGGETGARVVSAFSCVGRFFSAVNKQLKMSWFLLLSSVSEKQPTSRGSAPAFASFVAGEASPIHPYLCFLCYLLFKFCSNLLRFLLSE